MAFAPNSTYNDVGDGSIIGMFTEKEVGNYFEYSSNPDRVKNCDEWCCFPHLVWVTTPIDGIDSGYRFATVKKTVAYIVVDEDEYGKPVIEKWLLRNNKKYEV